MKEHSVLKIDKNMIDGFLNLILILQNTMAAMGHDSPLLPHSFMFPFLICLLIIIDLTLIKFIIQFKIKLIEFV